MSRTKRLKATINILPTQRFFSERSQAFLFIIKKIIRGTGRASDHSPRCFCNAEPSSGKLPPAGPAAGQGSRLPPAPHGQPCGASRAPAALPRGGAGKRGRTSYWMYCFRHSGVMCAARCSANFILPPGRGRARSAPAEPPQRRLVAKGPPPPPVVGGGGGPPPPHMGPRPPAPPLLSPPRASSAPPRRHRRRLLRRRRHLPRPAAPPPPPRPSAGPTTNRPPARSHRHGNRRRRPPPRGAGRGPPEGRG